LSKLGSLELNLSGTVLSDWEQNYQKSDAVSTAQLSFARAAELEDQGELVSAATWQTLGRVICLLISTDHAPRRLACLRELRESCDLGPISRECGEIAYAIEQRVEHIRRELKQLSAAGTFTMRISTDTTDWFVNLLSHEFNALQDQIFRLYALSLFDPCSKKSGASFIQDASSST